MKNRLLLLAASVGALAAMALADGPEASADPSLDPGPGRVWVNMAVCENEDGNPDGRVCVWIDKDTGNAYVNDSSNYR